MSGLEWIVVKEEGGKDGALGERDDIASGVLIKKQSYKKTEGKSVCKCCCRQKKDQKRELR